MENLNKENFWNDIKDKYPAAFEKFREWVDGYKIEVDWNDVFNDQYDYHKPTPKFHDVPFEFQHGILARFDIETRYSKEKYEEMREIYRKEIEGMFFHLQTHLNTPTN